MTIKELEQRTGMARANIRFYEGEGLLAPKRLENGYRDYSEEDARTLEKIKLLRQLQLDIDTIRRVQAGTLTLDQALFVQETKLEGDKLLIERAAAVCRELERSGVEYAALDPQPWLRQMEGPQRPALPGPSPAEGGRDNVPRACFCPWQRFFARSLDMALYDTLINLAWLVAFRDQSFIRLQTEPLAAVLLGMGLLALTLALEPLWLHYWGWTPGKWLFGLKLRGEDGEKLSIAQGWERSRRVAWEGYGWDIPIWNLWRMWQGRVTGLDGRDCPWDGEEGYRYTKVERRFSESAFVAARLALGGLLFVTLLWSTLPPCRGELTVEEFSRNYAHFLRLLDSGSGSSYEGLAMDRDGRWKEPQNSSYQGEWKREIGGVWVILDEPKWDEPEFTLEDGHITAVTLRVSGGLLQSLPAAVREELAVLALSGGTGGWTLFYGADGWLDAVGGVLDRWEDGEMEYRGLRIVQEAELAGYKDDWSTQYFLTPIPGEEQHCERIVTISLIE